VVKREIDQLSELSKQIKGEVSGDLKIAVIPTIAPFLLPLFLQKFADNFPGLQIQVTKQTTAEIMRKLKSRELDMGIISIPVLDADIIETRLYDEPFQYYNSVVNSNKTIPAEEMDVSKLCLLEEGHCMRTQVLNLCDLHKRKLTNKLNFNYKAGSIDSLLRFVKANNATTLLPYLSTVDMPVEERSKLRSISKPVPFRSIGIAVHRHFVKDKVLSALVSCIQEVVKLKLPQDEISGELLMPMKKQG
jgi:LysR family transcriptional regulator, hydrogen peroxide-inducible genes activator